MGQITFACVLGAVFVALCLVVLDMIEVQRRDHR